MTTAKRQGTFILGAGLCRTAGVAPPWKQDREAEQQQPTHTGSNALQSSNRRLRVARAGASVYVVVQRCCRIKPLQGAAGKAPGALPLSVPVCASLLLYYCCPPPPACVSAPFDTVGATTPLSLVSANLCYCAPEEQFSHLKIYFAALCKVR